MSFLSQLMPDERRKRIIRKNLGLLLFLLHLIIHVLRLFQFRTPSRIRGKQRSYLICITAENQLVLSSFVLFLTLTALEPLLSFSQKFFPVQSSTLYLYHWGIFCRNRWHCQCFATAHFDLHILWMAAHLTSISFCWDDFVLSVRSQTIPKQLVVIPLLPAELTHQTFRLHISLMNSETTHGSLCSTTNRHVTQLPALYLTQTRLTHDVLAAKQWTHIKISKWIS